MELSYRDCMKRLGIESNPADLEMLYNRLNAEGKLESTDVVDRDRLNELKNRYHAFGRYTDLILSAAETIASSPELLRWVNLITAIMFDDAYRLKNASLIMMPEPLDDARRMAALFPFFARVPDMDERLRSRGVPDGIIAACCGAFEDCVGYSELRWGKPAMNHHYFTWCQHYVSTDILRIGFLNFERTYSRHVILLRSDQGEYAALVTGKMHRDGMLLGSADYTDPEGAYEADFTENDEMYIGYPCRPDGFCSGIRTEYPRSHWSVILRPGDPILNIHIPRGTKLGGTACHDSYLEALEIHRRCFPEHNPKAIVCYSWLMDKRLDEICGGARNIANFQKDFIGFPLLSAGEEVFSFVFLNFTGRTCAELPEDTRLMRTLKARYLSGKHVHAFGGVIPFTGEYQPDFEARTLQ